MPAVGSGVDEPTGAATIDETVARPQVAVQPCCRLVSSTELVESTGERLEGGDARRR